MSIRFRCGKRKKSKVQSQRVKNRAKKSIKLKGLV